MGRVLLVGLGGFLGSVARYGLNGLIARMKAGWSFPLETLVVNATGCLVLGILAGLADSRGVLSPATRAFLFIGLLGGFTTFSAFGHETFQLLRDGRWLSAGISTALQVVLGIACVGIGHWLSRQI